ncbi:MAG: hypothetical protein L0Z50_07370, partial [Verrucomicrobiales bacterium]|nr:hypothetical protein [Verrucomicrobiales bacterium]
RPFAGNLDTSNNRPFAQLALDEIRIGATYAAVTPFTGGGGSERPTLSISLDATRAPAITYTGTLESASIVTGPYQPVPGATSPYKPATPTGSVFYRSRN